MVDEDKKVETIICANPDCRVAETGRCVEGHELLVCPYYGREAKDKEEDIDSQEERGPPSGIGLPSANTLTLAEASGVLREGDTRVIAVIGPSDSGKTSLIACVYDLFQTGPVGTLQFSRSRTLHAFEQTCHDARAASRRGLPHMNRTPLGQVRFYHLEIGGGPPEAHLVLLFGDRAGEEYRAAADDVSAAAGFPEVARADSLTVLVDGERLLDSGARHNLRNDIIMIIQGLYDGGSLPSGARLALVLTKLDAVLGSPQADRVHRDFASLLHHLEKHFGSVLIEIETFQIAASPRTDKLPRGTGVPELLKFWLKPPPAPLDPVPARPIFERAFARLQPVDGPMEPRNG